jgi:hypothetical protein
MLATSTLTKAQQSPLTVSEISPGAFRSQGRDGTHDARSATAKIGFVIGADAFAGIDLGGSVREGEHCSQQYAIPEGHVFQTEWKVDGSGI